MSFLIRWNRGRRDSNHCGFRCRRGRFVPALILFLGISTTIGCNALTGLQNTVAFNSSWDEFVTGYRNSAWASRAWYARRPYFIGQPYLEDFGQGFRDGYQNVADGGDGCTPAFPSRKYWGWRYQSPEGQGKVAAWFAGYPVGVQAARDDGVGYWTQLQTSSGIQQEYIQSGMMPEHQMGMYPIPQQPSYMPRQMPDMVTEIPLPPPNQP